MYRLENPIEVSMLQLRRFATAVAKLFRAKTNGVADAETLKRWYRACLARAWLSGVKSLALRNRQVGDAATFAYPVLKREPLFWLELPNAIVDITKNQSQQAVPR
jgi:hypothetical protein